MREGRGPGLGEGACPPRPSPSSLPPDPCLLPGGPDRLADPGPENSRALLKGEGVVGSPSQPQLLRAPSPEGGRGCEAGQGPRGNPPALSSTSPSRALPRAPTPGSAAGGQEPGSEEAGGRGEGGALPKPVFPGDSMVKNLPANAGYMDSIPGRSQEYPLEKKMATHSSILA